MSGRTEAARSALARIPSLHHDFHDKILAALDDEGLLDRPKDRAVRAQAKVTQLSGGAVRAMAKLRLDAAKDRIEIGELNEALGKSTLSTQARFALKSELAHAGLID